jgi:hypothetical protein
MTEWTQPDGRRKERPQNVEHTPLEQTWTKRPVRWSYGERKSKSTDES